MPAARGPRTGDSNAQSKAVKERLRRWMQGEYRQLWDEAIELTRTQSRSKGRRKTGEPERTEKCQEERNAERATQLGQDGQYTRALQALTSAGMADHSRAAVAEMKSKHPQPSNPPTFQSSTNTPQMRFTQLEVYKAVKSFKKGSAPGPSGLRPEHLKVALKSPSPNRADKALEALTRVVTLCMSGKVPAEVAPYFCGARLHAAKKKDRRLRPIAVGNILRRLVSKLAAYGLAKKDSSKLAPH